MPSGQSLVVEGDVWAGYQWRGGTALNSSGGSSEVEDFPLFGLRALVAGPVGKNFLAQGELEIENAVHDNTPGGVPADDSYGYNVTVGGHLSHVDGPWLFGAFGGAGKTFISTAPGNRDHDVAHWFLGAEGRYFYDNYSLAAQIGYSDAKFDDDAEGHCQRKIT